MIATTTTVITTSTMITTTTLITSTTTMITTTTLVITTSTMITTTTINIIIPYSEIFMPIVITPISNTRTRASTTSTMIKKI